MTMSAADSDFNLVAPSDVQAVCIRWCYICSMRRLLPLMLMLVATGLVRAQSFEEVRDLIRRGAFDQALKLCDASLRKQPRDYRLEALKGIALQGLSRDQESLAAFRRALVLKPDFLPALQGAAELEYRLRDPRCRQRLEALLRIRPDPVVHAMLGALAFEESDCAASLRHYDAAGEAANDPLIRWQRAGCSFQLEQWERAETLFAGLLAVRDDDRLRHNLGLTQFRAKRYREAIATLVPLAERPLPDPDSVSLLAATHDALRELPEAFEVLKRAINRRPDSERLYAELANLCLERSAVELGIEVLEVGLRNNPASARIQTMLGVLHARSGRMDLAESAFRQAGNLGPEKAFGRVGLAVAMMEMGAVDEAITQLREQAKLSPDDRQVGLTLAQALLQKDSSTAELGEARRILHRLTTAEPKNARAWSLLGKLSLRLKQINSALQALETAISLDPSDRNSTYQLMTVYRKQGRLKEASALQTRVARLLDEEREADVENARYRLIRAPESRPGK